MAIAVGTAADLDQPITAVVCTANRPDVIDRTVTSILANGHPRFELLVIDQSDDNGTARALASITDRRLRYLRTPVKGKARALNLALSCAHSEIVACTDDDCAVPTDWLERMAAAFVGRPRVAIVFGTVVAAPHDARQGYVPDFTPRADKLIQSVFARDRVRGLGACMGVRRVAIERIGGFDPEFGPGGRFPSCDDWDIAARALLRGLKVYETVSVCVVHHGFRTYREGRRHARRDWYAIGGMYAKPLRAGEWRMLAVMLDLLLRQGFWPPARDLLHLHRPAGFGRIARSSAGLPRGFACRYNTTH